MAIGAYRQPSEVTRLAPVRSGRATAAMPTYAGIGGLFGNAIKATVKAGNDWYDSVVAVGKAMSGAAADIKKANAKEGASLDNMTRNQL